MIGIQVWLVHHNLYDSYDSMLVSHDAMASPSSCPSPLLHEVSDCASLEGGREGGREGETVCCEYVIGTQNIESVKRNYPPEAVRF